MNADDKIDDVDKHEGDIEKGPEILRMHVPTVLENGSKFVQAPAGAVDDEGNFPPSESAVVASGHGQGEQDEEDDKLGDFDNVARSRNDEPILVEDRGFAWVVERYPAVLVGVRDDVEP